MKPRMHLDDTIKKFTDIYVDQRIRILKESVNLVLTSNNKKTRKDRCERAL